MANGGLGDVLRHIRRMADSQALEGEADAALVERFATAREEAVFAVLLRRHGPMVLGVCRRVLGREADAEDVFQATFLLLAAKAGTIRKAASVGSWLYGVAHRLAVKVRARASRRQTHEKEAAAMRTPAPALNRAWHDLQAVLDDELAALPETYRAALVACYLEGRTQEEAAKHLGCPVGTVRSRLARGRRLLQAGFARRGFALSAGAFVSTLAAAVDAAAVPAGLAGLVQKAAPEFAAGNKAAAGVSAQAAALVEGGLKAMLVTKSQVAIAFVAVGVLATGAAVIAQQALAQKTTDVRTEAAPRPAANAGGAEKAAETWRLRDTLKGHTGLISCLAFSPDGKTLASAAWDETVKLWDVETGKELGTLKNEEGQMVVAFSPDGKTLAVGGASFRPLKLWDLATQKVRTQLATEGYVHCLAFSPDGNTLAAGVENGRTSTVKLWDVAGEKERAVLKEHKMEGLKAFTSALAFRPDGKTLATCELDNSVRLWDVATAQELAALPHPRLVGSVAFSPDGKTLAALQFRALKVDNQGKEFVPGFDVKLWDVDTRKERLAFPEQPEVGGMAAFSPDGKLLATGGAPVRLWVVVTGEVRHDLGNRSHVNFLAFSPRGDALATAGNNVVNLWAPGRGPVEKESPRQAPEADRQRGKPTEPPAPDETSSLAADGQALARQKLLKEPTYHSKSKYCLLAFGHGSKKYVWLVLDGDVLYVDRNGNGDLTDEGERLPAPAFNAQGVRQIDVGDIEEGGRTHTNLGVWQARDERLPGGIRTEVAVKTDLTLAGQAAGKRRNWVVQRTFDDGRGPLVFADRPQDAPVVHFNGPLKMALLPGQRLVAGASNELRACILTEGIGPGSSAVVQLLYLSELIPPDVHPVLDIEFPPANPGKAPPRLTLPLRQRC